jgi:cell division protein FtsL
MNLFKGKDIMKRKKKFKFIDFVILLIIVYSCYIFVNQQIKISRIKKEITINKNQLEQLKEKNLKLQDEIKMSKSEIYVEKLARERLGLIKPGETPVINTNK